MGYTKIALKGVSWMGAFRMTNRILTFVKIAILARVLTPSQFGVFGIASLLLAFLEILTETGINVILIQSKDRIEEYLDSAWIVSILRGIFMFMIIFASAPFVAKFFNTPASLSIIILISLSPLIKGFINPAEVKFQKNLHFHYEFWFRTVLFVSEALTSIIVALITHSVYSLVVGLLISSFLEVILSFMFIKPTPKFRIDKNYFKQIFHKGKWITAYGIFNYFGENGDNIAVGNLLGASPLGIYQMAYKISYIPISEIANVVNSVIFPVYSQIDENRVRLFRAFWKTTVLISLLTFLAGLIIFLFPQQIITILLGSQWLSAVPVLRVLSFYGIIRSALAPSGPLFLAIGKQKYITFMTLIRFAGLIITIYPFVSMYGIIGAGYSAVFSSIMEIPVTVFLLLKTFRKNL